MSDLKSRLVRCCEVWADAHACGLSRIGKRVAGDANFFQRMEAPESTCNIATLERFARFLGKPENWPDEAVPAMVSEFVSVTGVGAMQEAVHAAESAPADGGASTGQSDELSGAVDPCGEAA